VLQKQIEQLISPGLSQLSFESNVQQEPNRGQAAASVGPKQQQQQQQQQGGDRASMAAAAAAASLAQDAQQGSRGRDSAQDSAAGSRSSGAAGGSSSSGGGGGSGVAVPGDADVGAWLVRCSVLLEKLSGGLMAAGMYCMYCMYCTSAAGFVSLQKIECIACAVLANHTCLRGFQLALAVICQQVQVKRTSTERGHVDLQLWMALSM
jgi:hypothetical protein